MGWIAFLLFFFAAGGLFALGFELFFLLKAKKRRHDKEQEEKQKEKQKADELKRIEQRTEDIFIIDLMLRGLENYHKMYSHLPDPKEKRLNNRIFSEIHSLKQKKENLWFQNLSKFEQDKIRTQQRLEYEENKREREGNDWSSS